MLDAELRPTVSAEELELLRIQAGTPAWGKEIDDRVLPAEAGLTERAVSFTKGCYPVRSRLRGCTIAVTPTGAPRAHTR